MTSRWKAPADMNLSAIPWQMLPLSSRVDFLQLAANSKPAIRVQSTTSLTNAAEALEQWAHAEGFGVRSDQQFTCIARTQAAAEELLRLDMAPSAHEHDLGSALGYPGCCCAAVAAVGEEHLDEWDLTVSSWRFEGRFRLIAPSGYRRGNALISHVPCSAQCGPSWELAKSASRWIQDCMHSVSIEDEPWRTWEATLSSLGEDEGAVDAG